MLHIAADTRATLTDVCADYIFMKHNQYKVNYHSTCLSSVQRSTHPGESYMMRG